MAIVCHSSSVTVKGVQLTTQSSVSDIEKLYYSFRKFNQLFVQNIGSYERMRESKTDSLKCLDEVPAFYGSFGMRHIRYVKALYKKSMFNLKNLVDTALQKCLKKWPVCHLEGCQGSEIFEDDPKFRLPIGLREGVLELQDEIALSV